ncbi:MAG: biotin carboxylase-like protein [Candidatus Saccharibacteria bacterium]|nr:biotin carboxylase-like protein [Candidatus Saccharibacteria bacterium]
MLTPLNKVSLAVTNPLHYVYYNQLFPTRAIAAKNGPASDSADILGFDDVTYFDVESAPQALIDNDDIESDYIAWKAVDTTKRVLGNAYDTAQRLESKVNIRHVVDASLFPKFVLIEANEVSKIDYGQLVNSLGSSSFVLQIDHSTGGKGTFFIKDENDLKIVLPSLQESNQTVVASEYIKGTSRALQCIRYNGQTYFAPWWHKDLTSVEGVYNSAVDTATKYCGAILENIPSKWISKIENIIDEVNESLAAEDYYGVFGLDIVTDETNNVVYLIELNPRFTAVSHLYATAMRAVGYKNDFLTAHVEGLTQETVDTTVFNENRMLPATYYYLKLQNLETTPMQLSDKCQLGVYDKNGTYLRLGWGIDALNSPNEIVVIPETAIGIEKKPGQRTYSIIGFNDPLDSNSLNDELKLLVRHLDSIFLI